MTKTFRTPALVLLFAETAPKDIQLFRVGTFHHPEYGKFDITPEMLAELVKNFNARVRGVDLAIDYKHENQDIAAGWITDLKLEDGGKALFASVDWTPKGKQVVADKEFRYISPEFTFNHTDNETLAEHGPTLMGAALTNRPVIKKMEPVVELSEIKYQDGAPCALPGDAQIKGDKKMGLPVAPAPEDQKPVDPKAPVKAAGEEDMSAMSPEEMMALISELKAKLDKYEQEAAVAAGEKKMAEKKAVFVKLMSEGKACAAQEESFIKDDMIKFAELAQNVKLAEAGSSGVVASESGDVDDKIHKLAEQKVKDKSAKDLSEAYLMVMRDNRELVAQRSNGQI